MEIVEAVTMFGRMQDRSWCDVDVTINGEDLWPEAMTGAVAAAGMLDDAENEDDLKEGIKHFAVLWKNGIVDRDKWLAEIDEVVAAVSRYCEAIIAENPAAWN